MPKLIPGARDVLLVVDVQNDFCPSGALGVPDGDRVVPVINRCIADALARGIAIYASRDWHPAVTVHFTAYGGLWPPHCVQGTSGAEFHPDLRLPPSAIVVSKGTDAEQQGYSAFEGHTADGRPLADDLRSRGIREICLTGLATDYCVLESVLDATRWGLGATVLTDAIAGIDVHAGDSERALARMREAGAKLEPSARRLTAPAAAFSPPRPRLP